MSETNTTLSNIVSLANETFKPFGFTANYQIITSDRNIDAYHLFINIDKVQPVIFRSFLPEELLIKVSLLKEALADLKSHSVEKFMPLILDHLIEKEKTNNDLSIINLELETNFQLFSSALAKHREELSDSQNKKH